MRTSWAGLLVGLLVGVQAPTSTSTPQQAPGEPAEPTASAEQRERDAYYEAIAHLILPNDTTVHDDYRDADAGLTECVGDWAMPVSPPDAEHRFNELLSQAMKNQSLIEMVSRRITVLFTEPLVWNLQGVFLAKRLSSLMEGRRWRRTCVVCASPVVGLGCRRVIARWLPRITFPYYLSVISLPNEFEDPSAQDVVGMRAPNGDPSEIANLCNFVVIVVERAHHVIPLAVHNISIWSPLTSQVILVLDAAPWLLPEWTVAAGETPAEEAGDDPYYNLVENSGLVRESMIEMLVSMWAVRRSQRIVVYQTTRPARFMAVDALRRRTLSICAHDDEGIWNVLSRNITNLFGMPVRLTVFPRRPTAVAFRNYSVAAADALEKAIGYYGMDAWILKVFSQRLNFTPQVRGTTDGKTFGYNVNGTNTGTLKDLVTGYSDIAFNQHFILDYNSHDVLPSGPVDYDALCVVVPAGEILNKWARVLQAIGFKVVLGFTVLSSVLVAFFWVLSINAPRRPTCNDSIFYMYAMLFGAPVVPQPKVCSQRMLIGCCAIFGVFATNSLQSQMATMLSRTQTVSQIRTLHQLDQSGLLIFTGSDSLRTTTFTGDNPLLQHLLTKVITPQNTSEFFRMIRSGRVARLNRRNSMRTSDEAVYLLPECPREYFLGYILPRCSPFLEPLNRLLSLLQSNGLLNYFKAKSYDGYHRHGSPESAWASGDSTRVKLRDMQGPFYMLFTGHLAAFGGLLGEHAVHRASAYLRRLWRDWRAGGCRRRHKGQEQGRPAMRLGRRRRRRGPRGRAASPPGREPSWIRPPRGPPPPEAARPPPPPPPYSFTL